MTKLLLLILAPITRHPLFLPIALPVCGLSWGISMGFSEAMPGTWQSTAATIADQVVGLCTLLGIASSGLVPHPTTPNLPVAGSPVVVPVPPPTNEVGK